MYSYIQQTEQSRVRVSKQHKQLLTSNYKYSTYKCYEYQFIIIRVFIYLLRCKLKVNARYNSALYLNKATIFIHIYPRVV